MQSILNCRYLHHQVTTSQPQPPGTLMAGSPFWTATRIIASRNGPRSRNPSESGRLGHGRWHGRWQDENEGKGVVIWGLISCSELVTGRLRHNFVASFVQAALGSWHVLTPQFRDPIWELRHLSHGVVMCRGHERLVYGLAMWYISLLLGVVSI
jgi:hypothetical protein